jgi:hypothetical protein
LTSEVLSVEGEPDELNFDTSSNKGLKLVDSDLSVTIVEDEGGVNDSEFGECNA